MKRISLITLTITSLFFAFVIAETSVAQKRTQSSIKNKARGPSQAVLTLADVKAQVAKQGCERNSIKFHAMELSQSRDRADDLFATCPAMCSANGCTYFVFLAQGPVQGTSLDTSRFTAAGIVDGECFTKATSEKGYFDLSCRSQSGEQSSKNIWRFNGVEYR